MRKIFRSWKAKSRAKNISGIAKLRFNTAVCSCADVSKVNHSLCFSIEHAGVFGGPTITLLKRPDCLCLTECFDGVIVRDGLIYELTKSK